MVHDLRPWADPQLREGAVDGVVTDVRQLVVQGEVGEAAAELLGYDILPRGCFSDVPITSFVPGTSTVLVGNARPVAQFPMRRIMPAMPLTPFATSRSAARSSQGPTTRSAKPNSGTPPND